MHSILKKIVDYYSSGNRWFMPIIAGFFFALGTPPFNSQLHPAFTFFPLLSFIVCLPLFSFSLNASFKRAALHTYLFGFAASLGQLYWIAFVTPEGLWHLIVGGVLLITLFEALFFSINGLLFRTAFKRFPRMYVVFVPAVWVCLEYIRSLGEVSFPWTTIGYCLTPLLSLSQIGSITGVYGMSLIIMAGNTLAWGEMRNFLLHKKARRKGVYMAAFAVFLLAIGLWGRQRLRSYVSNGPVAKISLVQPNIDQNKWGNHSLDTAFDVIESLVYASAKFRPDAHHPARKRALMLSGQAANAQPPGHRMVAKNKDPAHTRRAALGPCAAAFSQRIFCLQYGFFSRQRFGKIRPLL